MGGSISDRRPASLSGRCQHGDPHQRVHPRTGVICGVFGHKPSFGIVPSTGYLDHADGGTTAADMNVVAPIARVAEDLELVLKVLVASQPRRTSLDSPPTDMTKVRLAAWMDD